MSVPLSPSPLGPASSSKGSIKEATFTPGKPCSLSLMLYKQPHSQVHPKPIPSKSDPNLL